MTRLILHVGPGKCGSTTIQRFWAREKQPCIEKTAYIHLKPQATDQLNSERPDPATFSEFSRLVSTNLTSSEALILSHEVLFQSPYAVQHLCKFAHTLGAKTSLIGYSRRQSDFIVSAYNQWLFRSPERIREVDNCLITYDIDPILFNGLERQLIASIANDFHSARQLSGDRVFEWYTFYQRLERVTTGLDVTVKCGTLPSRDSDISLIENFCHQSELRLREDIGQSVYINANQSFDPDIVEAINSAVRLGFELMAPHKHNRLINLLSSEVQKDMFQSSTSSNFLTDLKAYIDAFFWRSNEKLCERYGLSQDMFYPTRFYGKEEVLEMIRQEEQVRFTKKSSIIKDAQHLSAKLIELCIKLAQR